MHYPLVVEFSTKYFKNLYYEQLQQQSFIKSLEF